ncbi:hypothetical protein C1646_773842 [Rhizophagus diaphanus]|nr:hypothetical protein C1646_773842 [Rhizophagus diaphanus] [Rhizophagus sp. MUCL 43196]
MEEDYDLEEDDSNINDSSNVIFKFIHFLASMNEPPILDAHEDTIVDSPLDNDHMSKINGTTNAYNNLVEILQHQKFEVKDIPSTFKETKPCYYLSIHNIIQNILNNLSLYNSLYFGPEIEAEEKKEFWHGEIWAESPLFGQDKITINRGTLV